jgi:hypothetical protein
MFFVGQTQKLHTILILKKHYSFVFQAYTLLLHVLARWADMPSIMINNPAIFDGDFGFAFNPGTAVADTPAAALIRTGRTTKFDGPHTLRVANIAKNNFSYAHKIS